MVEYARRDEVKLCYHSNGEQRRFRDTFGYSEQPRKGCGMEVFACRTERTLIDESSHYKGEVKQHI